MTLIKVEIDQWRQKKREERKRKQENDRSREPAHALLLLKQVTQPLL